MNNTIKSLFAFVPFAFIGAFSLVGDIARALGGVI